MWMIVDNSWKNIYRSPKKSILIFLIMFLCSFLACVIAATKNDISAFLKECNEKYMTIGVLEYIGEEYPEEYAVDEKLSEEWENQSQSALWQDERILNVEVPEKYYGNIEGYTRTDKFTLARNEAVLVVGMPIFVTGGTEWYQCFVKQSLFSHTTMEGTVVWLDASDLKLDYNKQYVIHVKEYADNIKNPSYYVVNYEDPIRGEVVPGIYELPEKGATAPEEYYQIAEQLLAKNNGICITATKNLENLPMFHQGELVITEGRSFTEEEYQNGSQVCVMNKTVADTMGKKIGDTISLSWNDLGEAGFWESYDDTHGFEHKGEFEIVGLTGENLAQSFLVFVPDGELFQKEQPVVGYDMTYFTLDNRGAFDFVTKVSKELADDFRFTIYDQGYNQVAQSYIKVEQIVDIVIIGGLLLSVAFLGLVSYILVVRQKNVAVIMDKMGAGKAYVFLHFLTQGVIYGVSASVLGAILGRVLHGSIWQWIQEKTKANLVMDLRFSDFNLSAKVEDAIFTPVANNALYVAVAFAYLALVCMVVSLFVSSLFKKDRAKKGQGKKKTFVRKMWVGPRKPYGSAGFAVVSLYRDRIKSFVVVLLALVSLCFGIKMVEMWNTSQNNYDSLLNEQLLRGYYTDYSGRPISGTSLLLEKEMLDQVAASEFIEAVEFATTEAAIFLGVEEKANGEILEVQEMVVSQKEMGYFRQERAFEEGDCLVFTTDMQATAEFGGKSDVKIDFMDGFDENFLKAEDISAVYGIFPTQMMEEDGIELGDTVVIAVPKTIYSKTSRNIVFQEYRIKVIGSFAGRTGKNYIYCPFANYDGTNKIHKAVFTVKGLANMEAKKDAMTELGMGQVKRAGRSRNYVVLEDGVAQNNLSSMKQQDFYTKLVIVLMGVVCVFGNAMTGYFLVNQRTKEIAIMRSLGAGKAQIYKAFTLDQIITYLLGCFLGVLLAIGVGMNLLEKGNLFALFAIVSYFVGVFVATNSAMRGNVKTLMCEE